MSVTNTPQTTALERIIIGGDLAQLSPAERVRHYMVLCDKLGIDWRSRPFDYLKDRNGRLQMYARKDATEQLRRRDSISLTLPKEEVRHGVYIVTAHAVTKEGRHDEDVGAVPIEGLKGEMLANAMLKATTKAKRRVTLSICGIGLPDETEIDAIPGAVRVAAELPEGAVPSEGYDTRDVIPEPPREAPPPTRKRSIGQWLDDLEVTLQSCETREAFDQVAKSREVTEAKLTLKGDARQRLVQLLADALEGLENASVITPEDRFEA